MELRFFTLAFTVLAVLGSIWAMERKYTRAVVVLFMCVGLLGLGVFSLL